MDGATRRLWQVNKYSWMSLAGVLAYMFAAQAEHLFLVPSWMAWALFAAGGMDCFGRAYIGYRRGGSLSGGWSTVFNGIEITLIAVAVAVTGGIRSDLWLLYFVVMIYESLYAAPREKRLLDVYVAGMYLVATLPGQLFLPQAEPPFVYWRQFVMRLFFLILVSALARRISANAHARDQELMGLREQMAAGEERARIAREIHDGLGHAMASAILRLELCARLVRRAPEEAETLLQEEVPALRAAWNESRDLAFHLQPWDAGEATSSLPEVLQRHIDRFAARTGFHVTLHLQGGLRPLRPAVAFGLIRIVQEALTNAARHAHCESVQVTLIYREDGAVTCVIADRGEGFALCQVQPGVGMQAMRERAQLLGGDLDVMSAPGKGTCITANLPG